MLPTESILVSTSPSHRTYLSSKALNERGATPPQRITAGRLSAIQSSGEGGFETGQNGRYHDQCLDGWLFSHSHSSNVGCAGLR